MSQEGIVGDVVSGGLCSGGALEGMELCVPCECPCVFLRKPVVLSSGPQGFLSRVHRNFCHSLGIKCSWEESGVRERLLSE